MDKVAELRNGFETAFINGNLASNEMFRPSFISNNPSEGQKVLSSIEDELLRCDAFEISVAFITMGGLEPLLMTLEELERRNVPGRILTTNYLNFSEPSALEKLHSLSNLEIRLYDAEAADVGFHTKGYIFKTEEIYKFFIGSSNLTKLALTSNKEWNTKVISTEHGEIAQNVLKEFNELWNSEYALDYNAFYDVYKERYNIIKNQQRIARKDVNPSLQKYSLKPNSMQEQFIANLRKIVEAGEDRALLISATGARVIIQTGHEKPVNSTVYGISGTCLFSYIS